MFYVLDENNNKVEAFDKEGVLAAIEKAIADGSLTGLVADAAFVTKLKCCVTGATTKMAFVSQAKYNELVATGGIQSDTYYILTDDSTIDELNEILTALNNAITELDKRLSKGTIAQKRFICSGEFSAEVNGVQIIELPESLSMDKKYEIIAKGCSNILSGKEGYWGSYILQKEGYLADNCLRLKYTRFWFETTTPNKLEVIRHDVTITSSGGAPVCGRMPYKSAALGVVADQYYIYEIIE